MIKVIFSRINRIMLCLLLFFLLYMFFISLFFIYNGMEGGRNEELQPAVLAIGCVVYILFLIRISQFINRTVFIKHEAIIIPVVFMIYFAILLFFAQKYTIIPRYDLSHAQREALNMLNSNVPRFENPYFYRYPQNTFLVIILYWGFKIFSFFGIDNFYSVNNIISCFMLTITVMGCYFLIKISIKKTVARIWILLFLFFNPVIYLYTSYPYTDVISMPFGIWALYFFMKANENKINVKNSYFYIISAVIFYFGIKARATVGILFIALFVSLFLKFYWKKLILFSAIITLSFFILTFIWSGILKYYGFEKNKNEEFPVIHFVMMGLNQETHGEYSGEDFGLTKQQKTETEKKQMAFQKIKERVSDTGLKGIIQHSKYKMRINWSDGMSIQDTWNNVLKYNRFYEYTVGTKGIFYQYLCQISRCAVILLMFVSCVIYFYKGNVNISAIAMLGGILFYLIWEVKARYSFSFIPWMAVLAVEGVCALIELKKIAVSSIFEKSEAKLVYDKRFLKKTGVCIILLTLFIGIINLTFYTQKNDTYKINLINNTSENGSISLEKGVEQTFEADKNFNLIKLKFNKNNCQTNTNYTLQILEMDSEKLLYEQKFLSDDIEHKKLKEFQFPLINVQECGLYKIRIISENATAKDSLMISKSDYMDYLPSGNLTIMGKKTDMDLTLVVQRAEIRPYTSLRFYVLLMSSILLVELYSFGFLNKINLTSCSTIADDAL